MEKEKHNNYRDDNATAALPMERREFLKVFGGGIFVFFTVGDPFALVDPQRRGRGLPSDYNAFLRIAEDGKVFCYTGKIEMGQGPITSLAQTLADELDVAYESVEMVMGDTDICPYDQGTYGSMTTRFFGPPLRAAAAEARAVLLELASERLKLPVNKLLVENGIVFEGINKQNKVSYEDLTKGKRIERFLDIKPAVKDYTEFKVIGRPYVRSDAKEKVTGKALYSADIQFPDLLYAKILRPPAHDATFKSVDTTTVEGITGLLLVKEDDLIAVLHKDPEEAAKALTKIKAQYDTPEPTVNDKNIFDHLLKVAPEPRTLSSGGTLTDGDNLSEILVEQKYLNSYVAHAPIEPHTATAKFEGDKLTVWASTQTPFPAKSEIARALQIAEENVRIKPPFVGGGFGGKTANRQAVEAARLAKITGKPVQVAWTRAEEFFYDTYRPAAIVTIKSGVSNSGALTLWDYDVYFAGERGAEHFYNIPHHRTRSFGSGWRGGPGTHPFSTGAWRAPSNNTNTFARESQIDIMASKAGVDPIEFRLKNLKDERMIRLLKALIEKANWKPAVSSSGRGYGVACGIDAGAYVAHVAEVEVNKKTGKVKVNRVVCVQDMGLCINPQGATLQIEGCITMGLAYALSEEIHFKGGQILDLNFDTYGLTRFSWTPKIETQILDLKDEPPQGGGEPPIICMGAVVANAIYDACGARLLQLPMTQERVLQAM